MRTFGEFLFQTSNLQPLCVRLPQQNDALLKMKTLSDIVKSGSQKMTVDDLKLCIRQESYLEVLSDLLSPLNPSVILTEIWLVPDTDTNTHRYTHEFVSLSL